MNKNIWIKRGTALGIVFFLAVLLVKPVGVSTQFVVLSGIFHHALDEDIIQENENHKTGYESKNAYYDKSDGKLAKAIMEPWNYDFIFVLAIPFGAYAAYALNDKKKRSLASSIGETSTLVKQSFMRLYAPSFLGGFIILYGARLADGCTSGHMMSGIMQGSISGYVFALVTFATAIPTAFYLKHKHTKGGIR